MSSQERKSDNTIDCMIVQQETTINIGINNHSNRHNINYSDETKRNNNKTWREKKSERRKEKRKEERIQKSKNKSNNNIYKNVQQYEDEEETWGDELTLNKSWPKIEKPDEGSVRIIHLNTNGISSEGQFIEWETMLHSMDDLQTDIFCINETKIDTRQGEVRYKVHEIAKKKDKFIALRMESSKQSPRKRTSIFKPGGTLVGVRGTMSGRILQVKNDEAKDPLGRWSVIHLKGKGNTVVSIFSVYQVCKNGDKGEATAYLQQQADCYEKFKKIVNPRDQLCKDIHPVIRKLIEKGNKVIICADINDDAGKENNNQWNRMMENLKLRNIHQEKHQGQVLPRTYIRGKRTLDIIALSENILNSQIIRAGILPFYSLGASDHRPMYIDINMKELFGECQQDTIKHTFRRFTTKNVKKCETYVNTLSTLMHEAKIGDKVNNMMKRVKSHLQILKSKGIEIGNETDEEKKERDDIAINLQKLDTKRMQLMVAAEKCCGRARMTGMFWFSIHLRKAAEGLSEAKLNLSRARNNGAQADEINLLIKKRHEAMNTLREAQKEDRRYRDEMLDELAEAKSKPWKMTKKQAAVIIKEAETHSEIYKKINATVKKKSVNGIKSVYVPTETNKGKIINQDNDDVNGNWEEVKDSDQIYEIILEQNAKMLVKSHEGITAHGSFGKELKRDASNEMMIKKILNGDINAHKYGEEYHHYPQEAEVFIKQMKKDPRSSDMEWKYGPEEYIQIFSHTHESKSCGPSGLHMSHWVAALQSDLLTTIHAHMTWMAFSMGIVYHRWKISWHSMLQKLNKPYITKLRIVQLFEGDMNAFLKLILGRTFMRKLLDDGIIDSTTYGSIPGKDAVEAMTALQYLFDNHRILRKDLIVVFNDAAGCYDRIRPNQAELCARRVGCNTNIIKTRTKLQNNMQHYIRTSSGVSKGRIEWGESERGEVKKFRDEDDNLILQGNIGGEGQGGGASPIMWLVVLIVMLNTFNIFTTGAVVRDPIAMKETFISVLSYVDDNSLVKSIDSELTIEEIFHQMGQDLLHWKRILRTTGGDLALHKCTVTLMKWKWGQSTGSPQLMKISDGNETIVIQDRTDGVNQQVCLKRLEVSESQKQLGIILPMDGNFTQEFERRKQMSRELGLNMYTAPLSAYESVIVYRLYYCSKVGFPLSVTKFTKAQCDDIQSQFYRYALPKMGLNRHTPHAVVFGPTQLGGMELHNIFTEQIVQHIRMITLHLRRGDFVGTTFISNVRAYATLIGSAKPLLTLSPAAYNYGETNSTIYWLWRQTYKWRLNIQLECDKGFSPRYKNESSSLMDDAVNDNQYNGNTMTLFAINACRLFHGVVFPSEMLHYEGRYLKVQYLFGNKSMRTTKHKNWPTQPCPTDKQWTIWRTFIRNKYTNDGKEVWKQPMLPSNYIHQQKSSAMHNPLRLHQSLINKSINDIIFMLPSILQRFVQVWEDREADSFGLWQQLNKSNLQVGSDGSHDPDTTNGAGGAIITSMETNNNILGVGAKCWIEEGMSSLTTEQYGIMSGVVTIIILCMKYGVPTHQPSVLFWVDSSETLQRVLDRNVTPIKLKEYDVSDYWMKTTMEKTVSYLDPYIQIQFKKVKSHQQGNPKDLPFEANLNNLADDLAVRIKTHTYGPIQKMNLEAGMSLGVFNEQGVLVKDIKSYLYCKLNGDNTIEYLIKKNNWTTKAIQLIDWKGMRLMLQALPIQKRIGRVQLIHHWQHTGAQKALFASNNTKNQCQSTDLQRLRDEQIINQSKCPFNCGEYEDKMHFMECRGRVAQARKAELIKNLRTTMDRFEVCDTIKMYLTWGLNWTTGKEQPQHIDVGSGAVNSTIRKAINDQAKIGWHNVRRGFISLHWAKAQVLYDHYQKRQGKIWSKLFVKWMVDLSWEMWLCRNTELHGTSIRESRVKRLADLQQMVSLLFVRARRVQCLDDDNVKQLFQLREETRKKKGVVALETWTGLAEKVLVEAEKKLEMLRRNGLDKWLNRENNYQETLMGHTNKTNKQNKKI